ncbi:MAG: hypothetical protein DCC65_15315 [Planctomycetota bacterium]|nr:MAG: hypothetical protein DCC65_15315 [Planctomycetota bacterium]
MAAPVRLGWPNRISIGRVLCVAPFVVILLKLHEPGHGALRWFAICLFAVMAVSDWLDGYLARRLHDTSPLGAFLDPLADKLLIFVAVIILAVRGIADDTDPAALRRLRLPEWVAVAAIGKDLIVCIGFAILRLSTGRIHIHPRRLGKWCTTVQLLTVLSMLVWPDLPPRLDRVPELLWIAATILAALAALDYIRLGSRLAATNSTARPGKGDFPHGDA